MEVIWSGEWMRRVLEGAIHEGAETVTAGRNRTLPNDPERLAYVADLIRALLEGRVITATYNVAIVAVLLAFAAKHWRQKTQDRKKWRERISGANFTNFSRDPRRDHASEDDTSSSSSSTIQGTATPPWLLPKNPDADVDVERVPLVWRQNRGSATGSTRKWPRRTMLTRMRGWLAYQPGPIPIVNRTLPSNAVTVFVLAWLGMNLFFHLYRCPLSGDYFFVPADRAGFVFIVNLPLLYLLAAKNQPVKLLTGRSYEALNIFHRRVGELMCLEALLHMTGMVLFQFVLAPPWLNPVTPWEYFTHPLIMLGFGALVPYELLYLTSLGSFRQRCYEVFLASHVMLQALALAFLYLHFQTSRPYVAASLAIFVLDRLVWRLGMKTATLEADLSILEDGETLMLSADWDVPAWSSTEGGGGGGGVLPRNIISGWRPTDHVFLTVPALGRAHAIQAHPFTIGSAAPFAFPPTEQREEERRRRRRQQHPGGGGGGTNLATHHHARLGLLIRTHAGFTRDLLEHARSEQQQQQQQAVRLSVRLDGPYGSSHALDMLRASDTAVLVAGGSGIAVVYPLAATLLLDDRRLAEERVAEGAGVPDEDSRGRDDDDDDVDEPSSPASPSLLASKRPAAHSGKTRRRQRVHLLWVTRSRLHADWIPPEQLEELVAAGLDLAVPEPTEEAGRPDTAGLVRGWIADSSSSSLSSAPIWDGGGDSVGVVVSGPDSMNREVRNTCAAAIGDGAGVRIAVEKFGW